MAKCKKEPGTIKCFNCNKKHRYQPNGDYCVISDKPKLKRVKAWAWLTMRSVEGTRTDKFGNFKVPCTILIDEKYLKGKGGKK